MFLIDINSLFDIKFLYKKAIEIITIKGTVSFITEGNLRIDMEGLEEYSKEINQTEEIQAFDGERGSDVDDILFVKNREIAEQKEQSSNDEK